MGGCRGWGTNDWAEAILKCHRCDFNYTWRSDGTEEDTELTGLRCVSNLITNNEKNNHKSLNKHH